MSAAEVRAEILRRADLRARIAELASSTARSIHDVTTELDADLREMVATHGGPAGDVFLHIARLFDRTAYRGRIRVDPAEITRLQDLHRRYPLALLPSHRSYIDPVVLASVLQPRQGLPPTYKLGGINVAFWPMGPLGRRAGLIFIRRSFRDDPVYKLALREYVGWLAEHRQNLEWYIEGGRTRTGKLRDPRLGLLAYLVDAVHDGRCDDFLLQPLSIVYDELLDVEEHARSATGAAKAPESLGRLVSYARAQRTRYSRGDIHLSFSEPISVREHLSRELETTADGDDPDALPLQKLAFEVAVRINTVTPITPPALITMALLWADRALTVEQLLALLDRYSDYLDARGLPVTSRPIATRATVESGLASLARHDVVTHHDHGREAVYLIRPEQRIAASYYRNGILHFFLVPAIVDLALDAGEGALHDEALRLRDLLKFEFFFAEKGEFLAEVDAESAAPDRPITAPFLRPFLEAYWVTAEALREHGDDAVDDDALLAEASGLAEQFLLQGRIYCADAVSSSYVEGAIRLARHRGLLAAGHDLAARRAEFADELHAVVRRVRAAQNRAAARFLELMRDGFDGAFDTVIEPSPIDADFLGLDIGADGVDGSVVVTHRLMSPRGAFYGGAGLALACTMMERATGRSTVWCTVQFVQGAAQGDQLVLRTEVVAHGHRTSQARVVARLDGREVFTGFGATGTSGGRVSDTFAAMPTVSPVGECVPLRWDFGFDPAMTHFGVTELREAVVHGGTEGGADPSIALWARVDGSPPWSPALLAFVADVVPMSIHRALGARQPGGTSLDNTLRIGPSVDTEWVLLALHPEAAHDGYGHGTAHLWAPDGTLMGVASQTFGAPIPTAAMTVGALGRTSAQSIG